MYTLGWCEAYKDQWPNGMLVANHDQCHLFEDRKRLNDLDETIAAGA